MAVVTFDGVNKIITEISVAGDNVLDVVEVYSDWKEWVRTSDNAKFLQAFSQVGGDPISATQNLGTTFFLENGWRIRPAELDHKLTLIGNIFTREEGDSVYIPTIGAFTVNTETRVSNLVDSSVARLDLTQLLRAVYINTAGGGSPGTGDGVGTPTNPSDNIVDAFAIATRDNLSTFVVRGSLVLDRNVNHWRFEGLVDEAADTIDLNGYVLTDCSFDRLTMTGAMAGRIHAHQCRLNLITGLDGVFRSCGFVTDFTIEPSSVCIFADCYSEIAGDSSATCTFGANSIANFRNYSGGMTLANVTAGCAVSVDLDPGKLTITASCTGGEILVRGTGVLVDNSIGSTVIDHVITPHGSGGSGGTSNELKTFAVVAGGDALTVHSDATEADAYFDRMLVIVERGAERMARRIKSYSQTNGAFTLEASLPFTPIAGDTLTVIGVTRDDPIVVGSGSSP